ncbi:hypothetical protein XENTR_v10023475 [Xenopus tropicalis]|uniref:Uncharacterized LOC100486692 n=1 Tax=Xenopus tropicalis TaxID=8364 RepID=A0A6I8S8U2_XENTR|nr:uncharacterized protein LOC100486692 [Xenopus tropicalis]XP_017953129.2 uncharacterized protein LOC100486692 [Xenopus tropicalis]KAE8578334.1 hypothetical protein XENTR_v10023475 [Xenopus tropicalis]KAE8578335.1 hypothetical protein XENTR_v10023475 [Xenopus tropicalis]KAE8578336.1 hypothetical protein XENTR_v10023475 [Xenopus tropicalis]
MNRTEGRRSQDVSGQGGGYPMFEFLAVAVLVLSWYLSLLPDQSDLVSMGLIITTFIAGSFLTIFIRKSVGIDDFIGVLLIWAVVTGLEMYIIIWRDDSSYYPTIVLTILSSGAAVWIVDQRFHGKSCVSQEDKSKEKKPLIRPSAEAKIGIFSRSGPEEYPWLISYLQESTSHTVVPFVITNTNGFIFREEVGRCKYAILYHSLRRGRINITDVTDSLYDDELEYLSSILGKQKVMVVVDDLDDSSSNARSRILQSQPKIANMARDLFLINKAEKQNISDIRRLMNPIKAMMSEGSAHSGGSAIVPLCFLAAWIAAFLCVRSPDDFYNTILVVITNLKEAFMIYGAAFSGSDSDSLLPMYVESPSRKKSSHQKSSLAFPLLLLVSAVLLAEFIVVVWEVFSVQMVPYIAIALGMDLSVILLFIKGPQIFSGHPRKFL